MKYNMKKLFIFSICVILFYGCDIQKPYSTYKNTTYIPKDFDDAERWFDSIHNYHSTKIVISSSL
jgi:hypothetical protein